MTLEAFKWASQHPTATGAAAAAEASVGVGAQTRGGWTFRHGKDAAPFAKAVLLAKLSYRN